MALNGYSMCRDFIWPTRDIDCRAVIFHELKKLDKAFGKIHKYDVVVQAGGNCGVFPYHLASQFGRVYTFEPEPENFYCLTRNVVAGNVVKIQGALGDNHGLMDIAGDARNCGAYQVKPGELIPTFQVDDLALDACDFLCLDVEGFEKQALVGAIKTLKKFHPVILYEDKGISTPMNQIDLWLAEEFGYESERLPRDILAW